MSKALLVARKFAFSRYFLQEAIGAGAIITSPAIKQQHSVAFSSAILPDSDDHSSGQGFFLNPSTSKSQAFTLETNLTFGFNVGDEKSCSELYLAIAPQLQEGKFEGFITEQELHEILSKAAAWSKKTGLNLNFSCKEGNLLTKSTSQEKHDLLKKLDSKIDDQGVYQRTQKCSLMHFLTSSDNDEVVFYEDFKQEAAKKVKGKEILLIATNSEIDLVNLNNQNILKNISPTFGFAIEDIVSGVKLSGEKPLGCAELLKLEKLYMPDFTMTTAANLDETTKSAQQNH